jgi:hypothetical protein
MPTKAQEFVTAKEAGIVRHISGDWDRTENAIRLRVEADGLDRPHDLLIQPGHVQALIVLLLQFCGKAHGVPTDTISVAVRHNLPPATRWFRNRRNDQR